ncbi:MAG: branched-chain amino acid aminotransferase [Bacteroidales bacterium]
MENIEWGKLPFGYFKTDYNVRCYWRNGEWGEVEISSSEIINIHMAATCLHYGQEAFEGMKAFRGKDGRIRVFRWEENAKRMQNSCSGIMMAEPPIELFREMMEKVIRLNERFVPPPGLGAALYLRPLVIGTGPQIGVKPAEEYLFMMFAGPVGPYFKEGFNPVDVQIVRDYDRTAPHGTGHIKVGGNYAASLRPADRAKKEGFATVLFVDSKENKYIDEAGPANFFGIKDNTYITPDSKTILPSITNKSLRALAEDMGMKVEMRHVPVEELETFDEVGACGTAAVITPIKKIVDRQTGKTYEFCKDGKAGPISTQLYQRLKGIQEGELEDKFGWITFID